MCRASLVLGTVTSGLLQRQKEEPGSPGSVATGRPRKMKTAVGMLAGIFERYDLAFGSE
jgi:hypothetical protein